MDQIPPTNQPKLRQKTIDAIRYVEAGLDPRDALQAANLTKHISDQAVSKFKEKVKRYSLTQPSIVSSAGFQIKRILKARAREEAHQKVTKEGQVINYIDNVYPTDSNILAAAAMVYDRYEPVQAQDPASGQGNTYIDLSSYRVQVNVDKAVDNAISQPIDAQFREIT